MLKSLFVIVFLIILISLHAMRSFDLEFEVNLIKLNIFKFCFTEIYNKINTCCFKCGSLLINWGKTGLKYT